MKTHQRLLLAGASFILAGCASKGEPATKVMAPAAMPEVAITSSASKILRSNVKRIFAAILKCNIF